MFIERLDQFNKVIRTANYITDRNLQPLEGGRWLCECLHKAHEQGGTCYIIGNGGSAGIASHIANDCLKALGLRALTLTDSNLVTCISNDLGYENVYSMPLKILMTKNDVLIAISSSGQSLNIIKAAQVAREKEAKVVTLTGFLEDNPLRAMGDFNIWLDSDQYGLVESGHFFILHTVIDQYKAILKEFQCTLK